MAAAFDPGDFVSAASRALAGPSEADARTAAGRAYYAAYGTIRARLCVAKSLPAKTLFKKSGRHEELVSLMASQRAFKALGPVFNGLLTLRVKADYKYQQSVDRNAASGAVSSAGWLVAQLATIPDPDFASFPLRVK